MALELKQQLKLTQKLLLTPELKLSIRLLLLSRQELLTEITQELELNPVLEDIQDGEKSEAEDSSDFEASESGLVQGEEEHESTEPEKNELDWQSYLEGQGDLGGRSSLDFAENDDDIYPEKSVGYHNSLQDFLLEQFSNITFDEKDHRIGEFIIGNIDDEGYLIITEGSGRRVCDASNGTACRDSTIEEIARVTESTTEEVEAILDTIQEFDPAGVAATTMAECLLLQAKRIEDRDVLVDTIITSHLDKLFSKDLKAIARAESMDIECVVSASKVITESLTPTPGSGFGSDSADVVVPDVSIKKVGDEYVVMLNDDGMPRLRISTYYKAMLEGRSAGADAAGYVRDKLRSALWLIKSVHQRQRTIKRTVECIARFQVEFLDRGVKYLKPMVLKDVAEEIGMHESTISRVTTNKYVDTPRGIFELKYFFNTAIGESENGSELTSRYIKEKIKAIIDGENARSPLSDQRICEMLKEASIDIARRTVAKYREELGLFPSSKRRVRY